MLSSSEHALHWDVHVQFFTVYCVCSACSRCSAHSSVESEVQSAKVLSRAIACIGPHLRREMPRNTVHDLPDQVQQAKGESDKASAGLGRTLRLSSKRRSDTTKIDVELEAKRRKMDDAPGPGLVGSTPKKPRFRESATKAEIEEVSQRPATAIRLLCNSEFPR